MVLVSERGRMTPNQLSHLPTGGARGRTAHSVVLDALRQAITDGTLPGGTRLIQAEIADQFDVSITPVREALRDLVVEELVELDPHRGCRVRQLDLYEVRELYELRVALEPLMVRRMIDVVSDEAFAKAQELLDLMARTPDVVAWSEHNRHFHALFSEPPERRSRLGTILAGLRDSAAPYVGLSLQTCESRRSDSDIEHAQLLAHYRARDYDAVARLTIKHLNSTLRAIEGSHTTGNI